MKKSEKTRKKPKKKCFAIFGVFCLSKNYGSKPKIDFSKSVKKTCFWGYLRTMVHFPEKNSKNWQLFWHFCNFFAGGTLGRFVMGKGLVIFFAPFLKFCKFLKKLRNPHFGAKNHDFSHFSKSDDFSFFTKIRKSSNLWKIL